MSDKRIFDACIVGAGLAGCATAIHLCRAGKSVLLIEKETLAHHKVCGEFLSHEAIQYLDQLGLDLDALGAQPINHVRLVLGARSVSAQLPFRACSVSRHALDEALIKLAEVAGATIERGVAINEIEPKGAGWKVSGPGLTASGNSLFLATGKHDVKGWKRSEGVKNDYIGFKMHYQLPPDQQEAVAASTEIILFDGGYAGFQPIENGQANLCLVVEKSVYIRQGKDWQVFLANLLAQTPHLANVLKDASPCWEKPLTIYGIPYGYVYKTQADMPRNLYRLGDQIAVIPSFAGGGMAIALHTARLTADHYLQGEANEYHHNAGKELVSHIRKSTLLGTLLASRWCQKVLFLLCRMSPALLTVTARYTRLHASKAS